MLCGFAFWLALEPPARLCQCWAAVRSSTVSRMRLSRPCQHKPRFSFAWLNSVSSTQGASLPHSCRFFRQAQKACTHSAKVRASWAKPDACVGPWPKLLQRRQRAVARLGRRCPCRSAAEHMLWWWPHMAWVWVCVGWTHARAPPCVRRAALEGVGWVQPVCDWRSIPGCLHWDHMQGQCGRVPGQEGESPEGHVHVEERPPAHGL